MKKNTSYTLFHSLIIILITSSFIINNSLADNELIAMHRYYNFATTTINSPDAEENLVTIAKSPDEIIKIERMLIASELRDIYDDSLNERFYRRKLDRLKAAIKWVDFNKQIAIVLITKSIYCVDLSLYGANVAEDVFFVDYSSYDEKNRELTVRFDFYYCGLDRTVSVTWIREGRVDFEGWHEFDNEQVSEYDVELNGRFFNFVYVFITDAYEVPFEEGNPIKLNFSAIMPDKSIQRFKIWDFKTGSIR